MSDFSSKLAELGLQLVHSFEVLAGQFLGD